MARTCPRGLRRILLSLVDASCNPASSRSLTTQPRAALQALALHPPSPSWPTHFPSTSQPATSPFSTSASSCSSKDPPSGPSSGSAANPPGPDPPLPPSGPQGEPLRISLQEAVLRLADAAVKKVEEGDVDTAIDILKEGVREFGASFPDSPEVGELHSQAALLLNMQSKTDEAAEHAALALEVTARSFGERSVLTGHRLLRLGSIRVAQGRLSDAVGLLSRAMEALGEDASRHEAQLYLHLIALSGASDASQVKGLEAELLRSVGLMKERFGGDSMVLSMALAQHDRLVNQSLGAQHADPVLCEALLQQHIRLLQQLDPSSEDLAIAHYKCATFQYSQDLLQEAAGNVKQATTLLRSYYSDDHPLVVMCMHRLGMICAASGDHRAATQLLNTSQQRYGGGAGGEGEGSTHALAKEAELGLAMAKFRAIDPQLPREQVSQQQAQALARIRAVLQEVAAAIGANHMLTQGGMRYLAQMTVMAKGGR